MELRNYLEVFDWHLDVKNAPDTFHCLTEHFKIKPTSFFSRILKKIEPLKSTYQKYWLSIKEERNKKHHQFIKDVKSKTTVEKAVKYFSDELGKQKAKV